MPETEVRLQKVLAQAGIGSRRRCEQLIEQGRVSVNGERVAEQGMRIDPATAVVHVDGQRIPTAPDNVVLVMNKPRGVITTMQDEQGRACVGDLVSDRSERLFHIGRLDADTEGLLLLTNDGELANRVGHPSHGVDKTYLATVSGQVSQTTLRQLKQGVELDDGPMQVDSVRIVQQAQDRCMLELVIHEGRNRIVRRLLDEVGHPVIDLVRTRIGPLHLGNLRPGQVRELTGSDLHALYTAVGL
ncbi:MAG: pseudouridine synthase [Candidatus Nanopelagicales bacterium]|nr:pseudouridine synthase [Candidatus Nanopelagicales bacterium]